MASDIQRAWCNSARDRHPREWLRPKLTGEQRGEIRARLEAGERAVDLAAEYGVSRGAINNCR